MPDLVPTPEQQSVIDIIALRGGPSVMIEAGAGCAKTSTLIMSSKGVRVPALAVAFNKAIADEMGKKLPSNFSSKTMNAIGFQAWARSPYGLNKSFKIDGRKSGRVVTDTSKRLGRQLTTAQWGLTKDLLEKAMQIGLLPQNFASAGEGLVADLPAEWDAIASDCWIDAGDRALIIDTARECLIDNITLAFQGHLSFDDQLYCPTVLGGKFPLFPFLFIDEDQDLNTLQHAMIGKCLGADTRLVAVGDKHQAIYGWRGALSNSADALRLLRPKWEDRQLMTTFRCPQIIVARQRHHVPHYRAAPAAPEGRFCDLDSLHDSGKWTLEDLLSLRPDHSCAKSSVAVLCRNNAPIMKLAFKLLRNGIPPQVLGRDIGKGLETMSKKLSPDDSTPIIEHFNKLREWQEREEGLAIANDKEEKLDGIRDRAESLRAVAESGAQSAGALRKALHDLFERKDGLITLSSIHKAKGLEWDVVLHLDPWRVPSKQAKALATKTGDHSALEQEYNLRYVAETRTKWALALGSLEGFSDRSDR